MSSDGKMDRHVIIIGAGISGLSAAWRLAEQGIAVTVLESKPFVGGLAATVRQGPYCMDVGPHSLFSEDAGIIETVLGLFDPPLPPRRRKVKFYYNGRFFDYPLTAQGVLMQMGLVSGIRAIAGFAKEKMFPSTRMSSSGDYASVEDWAKASFGSHLYRTFFKPYTEEFWKADCRDLSPQCIPTHTRLSFLKTLGLLLHKKISGVEKSLIERETLLPIYYPETGFGEIAEKTAAAVVHKGGSVRLGCRVTGIDVQDRGRVRVTFNEAGRRTDVEGDYVVSTIPIPEIAAMLSEKPPEDVLSSVGTLRYRALLVLGMVTEKKGVLGSGYTYYLHRPYNRLTELNEFSEATSPANENIIMAEISCLHGTPVWRASAEELFDMCASSLSHDDILSPSDIKGLMLLKASHAYPMYLKEYAGHLNRSLAYLRQLPSLATLGRCGEFMYMDIDQCIPRGFNLAENLVQRLKK